ncbi:MAG: beta-ketoacyl synthase chain length factor [Treponema sp.]|jgi:hypothetical protein|nr:beta-ketoacyl synthase chain length factor [Treponema sp.]
MKGPRPGAAGRIRVVRFGSWRPAPGEEEPDIGFTDPRFRRRLSLISRMTIRVIRDIMPLGEETKIYFVSFRGEVNRQFTINKALFEEGEIPPAAFSLSVFNAPPALASMALNLTAGYSAVYPGGNNFRSALRGAAASLLAVPPGGAPRSGERLALAYADEALIPEYRPLGRVPPGAAPGHSVPPLAFAALLSAAPEDGAGAALPPEEDWETPGAFLGALERAFDQESRP